MQHFFLHGGDSAVVVRVANRATRATIDIPAGRDTMRVQARQPGGRELLRVSIDYDRVERMPAKFNLVVQRLNRLGSELVADQELFEALSMDPDRRALRCRRAARFGARAARRPAAESRPDATRPRFPGQPIPYINVTGAGSDGDELTDYDIIGSNSEGTGLFALDRCPQVDFICVPSQPGRDIGSTSFSRRRAIANAAARC